MKRVLCTHCGGECEVADRAMSVFCSHCRRRLILEDFRIRSYHAVREFATCGDIVVEKQGTVAARITAGNLVVRGRVQGDVRARDRIEITRSGEVRGDLSARRLVVESGATIRGHCHIGPPGEGET